MYPLYPMYPSYPLAQNKLWGLWEFFTFHFSLSVVESVGSFSL